MNTRTSVLALALASASIATLATESASAWEGPKVNVPNAILAVQAAQARPVFVPPTTYQPPVVSYAQPTYAQPTYMQPTYAPSTTVSCGCEAPVTQTYVAPPAVERQTLVVEKKVFVPVPVEKKIYVQVPVEKKVYVQVPVEKRVYVQVPVEKKIYVQVPVVEQRPAVAPCNCEAPAPQAYVPPVVETQPTEAPCECEAPAQQTYAQPPLTQPQMQMPVRPVETLAPMDRRPAAFASRELQK